jgi:integrase
MRVPKPWFRKSTRSWFVQIDGRQVPLGRDKEDAHRKYHSLMAGRRNGQSVRRVDELFDDYLEHTRCNGEDGTYRLYRYYLAGFNKTIPNKRIHDLRPHDVQRWLDGQEWGPTTRKIAVKTIKGAFNWGVRQGLIDVSPLVGLKTPTGLTRDVLVSPEQWQAIAGAAKGELLDILTFLRETGARPQEARIVEAGHVRRDHIILPKVDSKGQRYNRVIWLTPVAESIAQRLSTGPEGRLFRNKWGKPWTTGRLNERCQELSKKLGFHFFPYALRHTWITEGLERGVDPVTLAILAGHRDTTMICRVYQHLARVPGHLKQSLLRATGAVAGG